MACVGLMECVCASRGLWDGHARCARQASGVGTATARQQTVMEGGRVARPWRACVNARTPTWSMAAMRAASALLGGMVLRAMCSARLLRHAQGTECAVMKGHAHAAMHTREQAAPCALTACTAMAHLGALCHVMAW